MIVHDVHLASLQLFILILLICGEPRNTSIPQVAKQLPEAINLQLPQSTGVNPLVAAFSSLSLEVSSINQWSTVCEAHIVGVVPLASNPYKPSFATTIGNGEIQTIIITHHQQK